MRADRIAGDPSPVAFSDLPGSGCLVFDRPRRCRADLDLARLTLLRHLAHEVDMEEPVLHRSALDLDMVGKLETALERAPADAAMEELHFFIALLALAGNREAVVLAHDAEIAFAEAGNRH